MTDTEKVIEELQSASKWFAEHGRNTNTAIIGICDRAVDEINGQRSEIERLKKDNEYILMQHAFQRRPSGDCWNDVIEKAKAEAVKEFAERLKGIIEKCPKSFILITARDIDNLVKEMVGEHKC